MRGQGTIGEHWAPGCRTLILIAVSLQLGSASLPLKQSPWSSHPSILNDCGVSCDGVKRRHVCGSDGRTYPSRCEVQRLDQCEGRNLWVAYKGRCRGASRSESSGSKCLKERDEAQTLARRPKLGVYIPICKADGTYGQVQCHQATGYCWCVTEDGRPIPGSSVRDDRPSCDRGKNGKPNKRRSGNKKGKKGCSQTDRATFNSNLIHLFSEEYMRLPGITNSNSQPRGLGLPIKADSDPDPMDTPEKRVIEWKFTTLDTNKDEELKSKETRSLKRLVKKLVKPKSCARNFIKYCDLDQNGKIARTEWSVCLGVDIGSTVLKPSVLTTRPPKGMLFPVASDDTGASMFNRGPSLWPKQKMPPIKPRKQHVTTKPKHEQNVDLEKKNCETERSAAIERDRADPQNGIFIPRCSPTNAAMYEKAQCHTSTGYCWCVEEVSGNPIPGTSTHKVEPDCNITPDREIKDAILGCPIQHKRRFLMDLMDHLSTEMVEYATNNTENRLPEPDPDHSLEERAVRWKLRMLDKNNNGKLERKELKELKKDLRKKKKVPTATLR